MKRVTILMKFGVKTKIACVSHDASKILGRSYNVAVFIYNRYTNNSIQQITRRQLLAVFRQLLELDALAEMFSGLAAFTVLAETLWIEWVAAHGNIVALSVQDGGVAVTCCAAIIIDFHFHHFLCLRFDADRKSVV